MTFWRKLLDAIDEVLWAIMYGDKDSVTIDHTKSMEILPEIVMAPISTQTMNGQNLYAMAKSLLGKQLGANNANDGYGAFACAESVNLVAQKALGKPIGGGASTQAMYQALLNPARFRSVLEPLPGDIVISETGSSTINKSWHGHCGIVANYGILSNNSEDGKWSENYTIESWEKSFSTRGFPTRFFRVL